MPTTTDLALPYPDGTNAPNVPADIQALAVAVADRLKSATYTTVGGTAPVSAISNTLGTIILTLVVPGVAFARTLEVSMAGYLAVGATSEVWDFVGGKDSATVGSGVISRCRVSGLDTSGSGQISGLVSQAASTAVTLRLWVKRVSGSAAGYVGVADDSYVWIQAVGRPC